MKASVSFKTCGCQITSHTAKRPESPESPNSVPLESLLSCRITNAKIYTTILLRVLYGRGIKSSPVSEKQSAEENIEGPPPPKKKGAKEVCAIRSFTLFTVHRIRFMVNKIKDETKGTHSAHSEIPHSQKPSDGKS
jgi:hypothetical protein